eukprot:1754995-Rhodomonas_salina.1
MQNIHVQSNGNLPSFQPPTPTEKYFHTKKNGIIQSAFKHASDTNKNPNIFDFKIEHFMLTLKASILAKNHTLMGMPHNPDPGTVMEIAHAQDTSWFTNTTDPRKTIKTVPYE